MNINVIRSIESLGIKNITNEPRRIMCIRDCKDIEKSLIQLLEIVECKPTEIVLYNMYLNMLKNIDLVTIQDMKDRFAVYNSMSKGYINLFKRKPRKSKTLYGSTNTLSLPLYYRFLFNNKILCNLCIKSYSDTENRLKMSLDLIKNITGRMEYIINENYNEEELPLIEDINNYLDIDVTNVKSYRDTLTNIVVQQQAKILEYMGISDDIIENAKSDMYDRHSSDVVIKAISSLIEKKSTVTEVENIIIRVLEEPYNTKHICYNNLLILLRDKKLKANRLKGAYLVYKYLIEYLNFRRRKSDKYLGIKIEASDSYYALLVLIKTLSGGFKKDTDISHLQSILYNIKTLLYQMQEIIKGIGGTPYTNNELYVIELVKLSLYRINSINTINTLSLVYDKIKYILSSYILCMDETSSYVDIKYFKLDNKHNINRIYNIISILEYDRFSLKKGCVKSDLRTMKSSYLDELKEFKTTSSSEKYIVDYIYNTILTIKNKDFDLVTYKSIITMLHIFSFSYFGVMKLGVHVSSMQTDMLSVSLPTRYLYYMNNLIVSMMSSVIDDISVGDYVDSINNYVKNMSKIFSTEIDNIELSLVIDDFKFETLILTDNIDNFINEDILHVIDRNNNSILAYALTK